MPKPDYIEDLLAFVEYLISRMPFITSLPFACDILLAETVVKDNSDFKLKGHIDNGGFVRTLQALDQYIKMLVKLGCLPKTINQYYH